MLPDQPRALAILASGEQWTILSVSCTNEGKLIFPNCRNHSDSVCFNLEIGRFLSGERDPVDSGNPVWKIWGQGEKALPFKDKGKEVMTF